MPNKKVTVSAKCLNRENVVDRLIVKPINPAMDVPKRPALGDVGNKLDQPMNNHGAFKKPLVKPVPSKDAVLKRQESILKGMQEPQQDKQIVKEAKKLITHSTIEDPDEARRDNPLMVTEYVDDVFSHLNFLELEYPIHKDFLENHATKPRMRSILVNWLVDIHENFKLVVETLHLCIAIVDRYLQCSKDVGKETLQLVGISALLLASKYEEMYLPELDDFVYVCDNTFSRKQVLQMEKEILKRLEFNLGRPTSIVYLRRFNHLAKAVSEQHTLGKYILELVLLDYKTCHVTPSLVAAATCCLSIAISNNVLAIRDIWTPTMEKYTEYKYDDFKTVLYDLADLLLRAQDSKYQAICTKYAAAKFMKISRKPYLNGTLIKRIAAKSTSNK